MKSTIFNLSHDLKTSIKMGWLYPVLLEEVLPGEHWKGQASFVARLVSQLAPVMHRVNAFIEVYFVPYRIIYKNWARFITNDETRKPIPQMPYVRIRTALIPGNGDYFGNQTLYDYMGLPVADGNRWLDPADQPINILPFRAYQLIWSEWYRDEDLQYTWWDKDYNDDNTNNKMFGDVGLVGTDNIPLSDGIERSTLADELLTLRPSCWERDYLTTCRPWPQKGPEILLSSLRNLQDLRTGYSILDYFERNARAGTRLVEWIFAHFGVRSPDYRLQRPEYIGGGKCPMYFSEVRQTSDSKEQNTPTGTLYGHSIGASIQPKFEYHSTEHGLIMGIFRMLPRTAYMDGIRKIWLNHNPFDYYTTEFAHLHDQPVYKIEAFGNSKENGWPTDIFGYQRRWAHLMSRESYSTGLFRTSWSFWDMTRQFKADTFKSVINLNESFVVAGDNVTKRIFADVNAGSDICQLHIYWQIKARKPIPRSVGKTGYADHPGAGA